MKDDMFIFATRAKVRFASVRGDINVEQLWDVPLRSKDGFDLNAIAKNVNKTLKDATEESFVETKRTAAHTRLATTLEIVKTVIDIKLAEEAASERRAEKKAEKEKLLAILAEKQDGKLSTLSENELKKRIAALDE